MSLFSIQGISLSTYYQYGYSLSGQHVVNGPTGTPGLTYLLDNAVADGANFVELSSDARLSVSTGQISDHIVNGIDATAQFSDMAGAIAAAEARGLNVMLKPQVGDFHPNGAFDNLWDPTIIIADPSTFFASYKAYILQWAQLAQQYHVPILSLGNEMLDATQPQYNSFWVDIINSVRQVYTGALTYSALLPLQINFVPNNEVKQIQFWNLLDYVGMDVYPSLTNHTDPSVAEMDAAWQQNVVNGQVQSYVQSISQMATSLGKPVLFTETGVASFPGANDRWDNHDNLIAQPTTRPDYAEQQNWWQSFFDTWAVNKPSWLAGLFVWDNDPTTTITGNVYHDTGYNINGKPADTTIHYWFNLNPPPPAGTTAAMILRHGADGLYEIYDVGRNAILAACKLGQVGTDWRYVGLGGFFGSDTTDMLLRSASTGGFEVYDIANNNITGAAFLGAVGLDWQVMGFGNFSSFGENDMILRNVNTGGFEVYDVRSNQIIGANFMGTVGLNWQFSGIGNFSGLGESDMLLRNSNTGGLEVYDIANNQITNAAFIGTVGLDWTFSGVGNFSGVAGETDLLLRNSTTGGLELYDLSNNQLTGAAFIGTVGLDWQFAGIAPIHAAGASDLVLRNVNTGAFEVYDIAGNTLVGAGSLGAVGLDWQLGGFSVDPPIASDGSTYQLVQAMAGFGGSSGAADSLNTAPLGADTSQQMLLTTPQHT
jgi:hypothetical protein